jgi:hypothetical protein
VAIDDPFRAIYRGVVPSLWVADEHELPLAYWASSALAEQIITPGATMSGFILPSKVVPEDEVSETEPSGTLE